MRSGTFFKISMLGWLALVAAGASASAQSGSLHPTAVAPGWFDRTSAPQAAQPGASYPTAVAPGWFGGYSYHLQSVHHPSPAPSAVPHR